MAALGVEDAVYQVNCINALTPSTYRARFTGPTGRFDLQRPIWKAEFAEARNSGPELLA